MQLVAEISIPKTNGELVIDAARLKKLRRQGLPLEWYALFAIELSYSHNNPSIMKEHFCEEWGIAEHEFDAAIAKQQKKNNLRRSDTAVQLELFSGEEQQ